MTYKTTRELDDKMNAAAAEERCLAFWENEKVYAYDKDASRENTYVVDTPPPTVSGSLHIGHIMSYTQTDVKVRYQRMLGKSVFYPIGWDDNGLPTERRVQNYFNISCNPDVPYDAEFKPVHNPKSEEPRKEVSRQNFIEACAVLTEEDEKIFEDIFKRIGHSYDWSLKYSTIGKKAIAISQASFLDLVKKGMAHSVEAPTMWDVTFQTAVAQAEIEDKEMESFFHDIRFAVEGEEDVSFTIATTRPEFLPACIAVVAHPDDERYQKYFGKNAIVPLFDIPVPIVPSEHAEMDKGTGIMMVCTFGDAADVAWWKASGLPIKQIVGLDGRILPHTYGEGAFVSLNAEKAKGYYDQMVGLKMKDARAKVVEFLREDGALVCEPKPIVHPVKFYEKGSQPLEFVSSRQWLVDIMNYKDELIKAGREVKWYPSHMQTRFETWVEGLNQDWCISRQRFFGVPFPVWYPLDENKMPDYDHPIFAKEEQLPIDPMIDVPEGYTEDMRGQAGGFIGEKDIMDTWATSALTPQIAMAHAPHGHHISLPFDVRPQAHDIIRTWAFYTIMKASAHENTIPWKEAHISGFVLDPDRKKMSKSKGNVITPMHLLEKYSSDAVRYWASRARLGIDAAFEEQIMEQGKKLTMKLFNASKFVFNIARNSGLDLSKVKVTEEVDLSWTSKMNETLSLATRYFEANDYAGALEQVEKLFWDFCDNYLEIVKGRAYSEQSESAVAGLMQTIDLFLLMFAPFCPFITEEIYQCRPWAEPEKSLHVAHWPTVREIAVSSDLYEKVKTVVEHVRKTKAEAKVSLRTPVSQLTIYGTDKEIALLKAGIHDIQNASNAIEPVFESSTELRILCVL